MLTTCFDVIESFFKKKTKKVLELVSLSHFLHDFWRKIFVTLHFIKWPNLIAWLPLLLEILGNMYIIVICCPVCDILSFEINHSFLIKLFFYITKSQDKNVNISRTKRALNMKWKIFFIVFKGLSIVKNCLKPEIGHLTRHNCDRACERAYFCIEDWNMSYTPYIYGKL